MRPHASRQDATAASMAASSVTSACNAMASPPAAVIRAAVRKGISSLEDSAKDGRLLQAWAEIEARTAKTRLAAPRGLGSHGRLRGWP